jgi:hypothetical protein
MSAAGDVPSTAPTPEALALAASAFGVLSAIRLRAKRA